MPNFGILGKLAKAEEIAKLEETIEVDGRIMKKRDAVEFEIEKRLGWGQSQADIQKALKGMYGIEVDPNFVKERLAVARRRDPRLKGDPSMRKMEAEYILQKGIQLGTPFEDISKELVDAGFNGPKIIEHAKAKINKRNAEGSMVGGGGAKLSQWRQEGLPKSKMADYRMPERLTDEDLMAALKAAAEEAAKRARDQVRANREKGADQVEGFDWSGLQDLGKMWQEQDLRGAKVTPDTAQIEPSPLDAPARPSDVDVSRVEQMRREQEVPPDQMRPEDLPQQ